MKNTLLIVIVLSLVGICTFYILSFRKKVYEIMQKEHANTTTTVDSLQDFKKIYLVIKKNKNISKYERLILRQHLVFTTIGFCLFLIFVYLILFTEW